MRSIAVTGSSDTKETARSSQFELLRCRTWRWLPVLLVAILTPLCAIGQIGGTGTIAGTVTDSTGAIVIGAKVVARNTATGNEMARTASKSGLYTLAPLDPEVTPSPLRLPTSRSWCARTSKWMACNC